MKKLFAILLVLATVLGMTACTVEQGGGDKVEISLWTYPIGNWGDQRVVDGLIANFQKEHPDISVKVEYLTYTDGDDKVNTAIEGNKAPDIIMEGPERLVANWGAKGLLVDLSDMVDAADRQQINPAALAACYSADGKCYEYPLVMTAHSMAINKTVFEAAGALQYLDTENRTWSTENFIKAVEAVHAYTNKTVGAIYCKGQGGDQGTRALVNNLFGGKFTDAAHSAYTWDSEENIKALETLLRTKGIVFDAGIVGSDEIALFYNGTLNMAFCWNVAQQLDPNSANTGAGKTANGDEILFMGFPTEDGSAPQLQGGIWGFGIFDNGDEKKIEAAKTFIKYMCDSSATLDAVKAANYFAVRDTAEGTDLTGIWEDNAVMKAYSVLMPYLGDYYQVTTGWAEARTQWWNMLQKVGAGQDVASAVKRFCAAANGQ